jgi:hypothetical protein
MAHLAGEILLRLVKPGLAALLGLLLYLFLVGPLGEPGSISLALLSWLAAAAFVLLAQEGPL